MKFVYEQLTFSAQKRNHYLLYLATTIFDDFDRGSTTISTSTILTTTSNIVGTTVRGNIPQATRKAPITRPDLDNGSTIISTSTTSTTTTLEGTTTRGDIRQASTRKPRITTRPPTTTTNQNKGVRKSTINMQLDLIVSSTSTVGTSPVITDGTTVRGAAPPA